MELLLTWNCLKEQQKWFHFFYMIFVILMDVSGNQTVLTYTLTNTLLEVWYWETSYFYIGSSLFPLIEMFQVKWCINVFIGVGAAIPTPRHKFSNSMWFSGTFYKIAYWCPPPPVVRRPQQRMPGVLLLNMCQVVQRLNVQLPSCWRDLNEKIMQQLDVLTCYKSKKSEKNWDHFAFHATCL